MGYEVLHVEENPGMGQQGVLYYYRCLEVLSTMDIDILKASQGSRTIGARNWRATLQDAT